MQEAAKKFANIELKIKELNTSLKTLREEKENVSEILKTIMTKENIEMITLNGYNIVLKNTKQYGSLNKEYLETSLSEFCNEAVINDTQSFASKAAEHVINNREVTEKQVIRLLRSKQ